MKGVQNENQFEIKGAGELLLLVVSDTVEFNVLKKTEFKMKSRRKSSC